MDFWSNGVMKLFQYGRSDLAFCRLSPALPLAPSPTPLLLVLLALTVLALPVRAAIPDNDNFATRTRLSGSTVSTTGSNVDATQEIDEPDPSFAGGKSV